MKYLYIITCFVAIFLSGCKKDFLERSPRDAYSNSSLWTSKNDVTAALNACYSGWEYGDNVVYNDCMTDIAYDQFPWEGYETLASGYATPNDVGIGRWDFKTVQRCNWFLDNVDKTPSTAVADPLKARMKGEARFLRAYQYFIMSQNYGDVPLILHELKPSEANTVSKASKASVIKFILDELTAIAADLPISYSGTDVGRITRGAALGLKARVELYNEKWADCIATCQQLMAPPFTYKLFPNYAELFRPGNANNEEVILDVQYLKDDNSAWVLQAVAPNSQGGWSSIVPTQKLVDAYETINGKTIQEDQSYDPMQPYKNRDPRLDASIIRPGTMYEGSYFDPYDGTDYYKNNNCSPTGYNVRKFVSQLDDFRNTEFGTDIDNTGLNFIVMRYAEILLSYAEAKIEAGQIDASVYDAINKVRKRAGMPDVDETVYNSLAKLRTLIRRERTVELALEGLRWFDIQRWKIGEQVMPGIVQGALLGSVNSSNGALTLTSNRISPVAERTFSSKNYLFPIPQKEMDLNKNLKQNDGY
ncbi:RagB/SusD family nutrient uptake outer membrane protein [Chitinophagaceae bacterium LB-8]|uniref:RagB/SusD family nutrient uptake outer membrane protein n=1 Tax=Paraflavisolibacter caeni TaxID=2982496 RepID=A0A9X2XW33_9BACT|nr:RagB/SusD family nutrient uptake outer membrane protein [Paraflavisolibacter caeni]MCU7549721.1 RagB/SusD family nutrient uptake outer membrane protein [Paraflavisolibacter caeni]